MWIKFNLKKNWITLIYITSLQIVLKKKGTSQILVIVNSSERYMGCHCTILFTFLLFENFYGRMLGEVKV